MTRAVRLLLLVVSAAAAASGAGCATLRNDATVCPEYRNLRCATAPECSMDQARGCRVCSCTPARAADERGKLPSPVQPDVRPPEPR